LINGTTLLSSKLNKIRIHLENFKRIFSFFTNAQLTGCSTEAFNYFRIKGCAAQHCCNDDQQSQWENGDLDPLFSSYEVMNLV